MAHLGLALSSSACDGPQKTAPLEETATLVGATLTTSGSEPASSSSSSSGSTSAASAAPAPVREAVTLIAGGDVCMGRSMGQEILKDPSYGAFASIARVLSAADIRFVNLESQLSDQKGETQSPTQKLVFTGPPGGAEALARGGIDIVSLANNHMWDYGQSAFLETLANLERAKVKYAGAGRTRERAYGAEVVSVEGFQVAFLAFTDIWNQGALSRHPAKEHVAEARREAVVAAIRGARALAGVTKVVVSYHGGEEYVNAPLQRAIDLHRAAIDAGADAVIGHHPHVAQGIEIYKGKPIFYSLGNFLMRTHGTETATEIGLLARIELRRSGGPRAWVCPFRIAGYVPRTIPLAGDERRELYERVVRQRLRVIQGSIARPAVVGDTGEDGCAELSPPVPKK
ncbi:MAG: CapA family protein [Polyangiaceae bacterium]